MKYSIHRSLCLLGLAALSPACATESTSEAEALGSTTSAATVVLAAPQAYQPPSGSLCAVIGAARNAPGAPFTSKSFPVAADGVGTVTLQVPAGNLTFIATLFDGTVAGASSCGGSPVFEGKAGARVLPGGATAVAITLQPLPGTASISVSYADELGCPEPQWDPNTETCSEPFEAVLSGSADPSEGVSVDDDLTVYVNGEPTFVDEDLVDESSLGCGALPPIRLTLQNGDAVRIVATDRAAPCRELSPGLTLHRLLADGTVVSQPVGGYDRRCDFSGGVFYDRTLTVEL